jgi:hypothetical protein
VWPVNPNARLELVAIQRTRGRPVLPQGFEDRGFRLADAGQQRIVQGALGFQAESVSLNCDNHAAPLKFGQDFDRCFSRC